ncbi:unnamed protein product [Protopolystoma xenopodis]|uniref:Uncharacterized protein n=1 Tax=Protopolystoma xenopodis TaxID=117903 RepID=A0A448XM46_9PLAT|nr:unnamed protein product [Protopolystoma xenopodis]
MAAYYSHFYPQYQSVGRLGFEQSIEVTNANKIDSNSKSSRLQGEVEAFPKPVVSSPQVATTNGVVSQAAWPCGDYQSLYYQYYLAAASQLWATAAGAAGGPLAFGQLEDRRQENPIGQAALGSSLRTEAGIRITDLSIPQLFTTPHIRASLLPPGLLMQVCEYSLIRANILSHQESYCLLFKC